MYLQVTRMSCGLGCAAHVWPHRKPRRMQVLEARVLLSFPSGGSGIVPQSVQIVEEFRISVNSPDILPRASARSFIHSFIRSVPLPSSLSHGASHAVLRKTRFNAEVLTSSWDGNWRGWRGRGGRRAPESEQGHWGWEGTGRPHGPRDSEGAARSPLPFLAASRCPRRSGRGSPRDQDVCMSSGPWSSCLTHPFGETLPQPGRGSWSHTTLR